MNQISDLKPLTDDSDWAHLYDANGPAPSLTLTQPYEKYFWGDLLPRLVQKVKPGGRLIELGSAPGRYAMMLSKMSNTEPFGVEYTESGAALNRRTFEHFGVNPGNVFHDSFLSPDFIANHRNSFDAVSSFGLIEHFHNPKAAVEAHLAILKPGGTLIVSVPNYRGWNGFWMNIMDPKLADGHNFDVMKLPVFKSLFEGGQLDIEYLGMAARYHFFFSGNQTGWRRVMQLIHINIEPIIHKILGLAAKFMNVESRFFSPYILCVARKRGA
jgi:SAM-dependent methyltransferase